MNRERRRSLWVYLKPLVDAMLIVLSFGIAYWIRYELQWFRQVESAYLVPFLVYIPSIVWLTIILFFVKKEGFSSTISTSSSGAR